MYVVKVVDYKDYANDQRKVFSKEDDAYMFALTEDWRMPEEFHYEDPKKFPAILEKWCAAHGYVNKSPKFVYEALVKQFFQQKRRERGIPLDAEFDDEDFNDGEMITEVKRVQRN